MSNAGMSGPRFVITHCFWGLVACHLFLFLFRIVSNTFTTDICWIAHGHHLQHNFFGCDSASNLTSEIADDIEFMFICTLKFKITEATIISSHKYCSPDHNHAHMVYTPLINIVQHSSSSHLIQPLILWWMGPNKSSLWKPMVYLAERKMPLYFCYLTDQDCSSTQIPWRDSCCDRSTHSNHTLYPTSAESAYSNPFSTSNTHHG